MADSNTGNSGQYGRAKIDLVNGLFLAPFKAVPAAKIGLEVMALAGRRTQAVLDLTAKTSRCRSTGDLANVATEFWQTAWAQQIDSASKIAALFTFALPASAPITASKPAPVRDVLMIPEAAADTAKTTRGWTDQTNRRAA
jgi:hypothetical protein